jgi:chromosome segregation ATPase
MVEQLQLVLHKISTGMIYAEEILKKTQQINSAVEIQVDKADSIKLEIAGIATHTQNIEQEIQQWHNEIQDIHDDISKTFCELTNKKYLIDLSQELYLAHTKLNEFQKKVKYLDEVLLGFNLQINQGLDSVQHLVSQVEIDKKEITDLTQNIENRFNQVMQLQSNMEKILQIGDNLENIGIKISQLEIVVRTDKEALQRIKTNVEQISVSADNSVWELRGEIERLRESINHNSRELKNKLQAQLKNQQRLDSWLLSIAVGVAFLTITLLLGN